MAELRSNCDSTGHYSTIAAQLQHKSGLLAAHNSASASANALKQIIGRIAMNMMDVLMYMVTGVSILAVILLVVLVKNIYDQDHPLNQNRTDVD